MVSSAKDEHVAIEYFEKTSLLAALRYTHMSKGGRGSGSRTTSLKDGLAGSGLALEVSDPRITAISRRARRISVHGEMVGISVDAGTMLSEVGNRLHRSYAPSWPGSGQKGHPHSDDNCGRSHNSWRR